LAERPLEGRSILILEDEFLIAMDIEQICLDWGAEQTTIIGSLAQLGGDPFVEHSFDAAILDLRLGGESTLGFAKALSDRGLPFVFATGMTDPVEIARSFPGVPIVSKPYSGDSLIRNLSEVMGRAA